MQSEFLKMRFTLCGTTGIGSASSLSHFTDDEDDPSPLMTPKLQDRIIYDKIRDSGRKILDELDKVSRLARRLSSG